MLIGFFSVGALIVGIGLWGRFDVNRFLTANQSLQSIANLSEFKSLVRRNMLVAVFGLGLSLIWGLMSAMIAWQFGILGVIMVLAVAVPLLLLGKSSKKLEAQARSLPCLDQQLEAEYRQVGQAWSSKLFPDF